MDLETIEILQFIGTAIIGITIWFKDTIAIKLGIKQGKQNLEKEALLNLQKNLDIYQEMVTDIDLRYKAKIADLEISFKTSIKKFESELQQLQELNKKLQDIISKQTRRIKYYNDKYGDIEQKTE